MINTSIDFFKISTRNHKKKSKSKYRIGWKYKYWVLQKMMFIIFSEGNFQTLVTKKALSHLKMHFNLHDYRYENIKYHIVITEVWTILNQNCLGIFRLFSMNIEVSVGLKWGNWYLSHGFITFHFIIGESLFS